MFAANTEDSPKQRMFLGPWSLLNEWLETHECEKYVYNYLSLELYSVLHKHTAFMEDF